MCTPHGLNCFSHVIYTLQTSTYQNIAENFDSPKYNFPNLDNHSHFGYYAHKVSTAMSSALHQLFWVSFICFMA